MRENSLNKHNYLHWHDGSTCHGFPTLAQAIKYAKHCAGHLFILKVEDRYENGPVAICYSSIYDSLENRKHGKIVATVKSMVVVRIIQSKT